MAQRKRHTGQFKARVAVEAIGGHKTVNEIATEYGIHPSQVNKWKKQALEQLPEALSDGRGGNNGRQEEIEARLYQRPCRGGAADWPVDDGTGVPEKKVGSLPIEQRRTMIERERCQLSMRAQCRLLGVNRSSAYYEPRAVRQSDLAVMRLLDEQYTLTPQYGVERMTAWLKRKGIVVGHNRVRRLMRLMGMEAIYPKPRLSQPRGQEHHKYPYLLRGLSIERPNHVWAADITYIRLWRGFVYLVAIFASIVRIPDAGGGLLWLRS